MANKSIFNVRDVPVWPIHLHRNLLHARTTHMALSSASATKWREVIWKIYDIKHIILLGSKMFDSAEPPTIPGPADKHQPKRPNDHIFVYVRNSLCVRIQRLSLSNLYDDKTTNSSAIRHMIWKIWLPRMPFRSFHSNEWCPDGWSNRSFDWYWFLLFARFSSFLFPFLVLVGGICQTLIRITVPPIHMHTHSHPTVVYSQ